ncbi:class I SAM-dependent DNA methyltransferase [Sesbania bispinosa]|nr:class I SAM-dependent DNA methyltransferase [Sesbania bispinosa]
MAKTTTMKRQPSARNFSTESTAKKKVALQPPLDKTFQIEKGHVLPEASVNKHIDLLVEKYTYDVTYTIVTPFSL